ncbi:hypothetical protein RC17_04000 [Campylobacter jejuni]|uniref:Cj0814 family flagellar-dependent secreted protein n=1 Tax=Campylobacter jejuni TaxID=197 RepID=UPI00073E0B7B|nr:hypothetical protein [Campylobacter jejuni]ALW61912.1 hypothetical protein RC17_04000 [Campylobacter jejuni]
MSIFSINDNSNYNSILSQAKANKESKENSKISFANAFLKQNASKLNEIQSANSQTLARSEVLNSTNTTNTSNNTNFSISSKTNSPNLIYQVNNKAAGLPEDFKIHKSTLDEIKKAAENDPVVSSTKEYLGVSEYYTNIDMAETIKQYYNQFNQIVNYAFNDTNKTSFTEADINSIPKGISELSSDKTIGIMPKNYDKLTITNYYNTQEQYNEAEQLGMFGHINIGLQPLNFTPQSMQTQNLDFASLLKSYAQDGWLDADIYVMDKGVKWQNTSIGYGGAWFDNQFNQAKANGWKASSESINSFADSIADRLNNLIGQTRV